MSNDVPLGGSAEPVAPPQQPVQNTDRELWRERPGDYYADSIFVTEGGGIGLNCGGSVFVKPPREWHRLAMEQARREPPPHACTQPGFNERADVCPACALARAPQGDAAPADAPHGTFRCPICLLEGPHYHSVREIAFRRWAESVVRGASSSGSAP